ncbi:TetR/AcrR family transcriptional regulator [Bacillus tuaregi]|uniref:TetR/AcrR family transcriptional regulator n=1 Tax=Bacillus tuaregi TaxID=1816695 RepID=UPI0008F8B33E|nr:TetR/AcrR family transcriptional regulator [Bacillus tuaregi]
MKELTKRDLQAMQTQEHLLQTSIQLIIEKGYDNVTISEICQICEVAKGTFYTHFSSKKDILIKILADINENMFEKILLDENHTTFEQILEYIKRYMITIQEQGVDFTRVFLKIIIDEHFDTNLVKAHLHANMVGKILDCGKSRGEIRSDISTEQLSQYLQAFIYGIMIDWLNHNGDYDIVQYGLQAVRAFLDMTKAANSL